MAFEAKLERRIPDLLEGEPLQVPLIVRSPLLSAVERKVAAAVRVFNRLSSQSRQRRGFIPSATLVFQSAHPRRGPANDAPPPRGPRAG